MKTDAAVPCEDTARRVAALLAAGITVPQIAEVSHLSNQDIRELRTRKEPVPGYVARAVELAWEHLHRAPPRFTRRRVAEMLDAGITVVQAASASGLSPAEIRALRMQTQPVTPGTERRVKAAWEALLLRPAPTACRVAELLALGFTVDLIADVAGLPAGIVGRLPQRKERIPFYVAEAIERADEYLTGPPTPDDDIDEVLIERIIDGCFEGKPPEPERRQAVRLLYESGLSVSAISDRLHLAPATVRGDLDALGVEHGSAAR